MSALETVKVFVPIESAPDCRLLEASVDKDGPLATTANFQFECHSSDPLDNH
jgi:hypothetical protein